MKNNKIETVFEYNGSDKAFTFLEVTERFSGVKLNDKSSGNRVA